MRLPCILFSAALLCCPLGAAEPVYIHPATRLEFPETLGLFKFVEGRFYPDPELGVNMAFEGSRSAECQVTLYLGRKEGTVEAQLDDVKAALLEIEKQGTYSKVRFGEPVKIAEGTRSVSATFRVHSEEEPDQSEAVKSYILLVTLPDNLTLKARLTSRATYEGHDEHVASLEKEVLGLAAKVKAPAK